MSATTEPPQFQRVVIYDRDATGTAVSGLRINELMNWAHANGLAVLAVAIDVRPAALEDGNVKAVLDRPDFARAAEFVRRHTDTAILAFSPGRISELPDVVTEVVRALHGHVVFAHPYRPRPLGGMTP